MMSLCPDLFAWTFSLTLVWTLRWFRALEGLKPCLAWSSSRNLVWDCLDLFVWTFAFGPGVELWSEPGLELVWTFSSGPCRLGTYGLDPRDVGLSLCMFFFVSLPRFSSLIEFWCEALMRRALDFTWFCRCTCPDVSDEAMFLKKDGEKVFFLGVCNLFVSTTVLEEQNQFCFEMTFERG